MKQFRLFGVGIVMVIFFGIAACSPKTIISQPASISGTEEVVTVNTGETQAVSPPAEVQVTETTTMAAAGIDMEALILEKLQNHHSINRVYGALHTREEWNATLDRMIGYGAKINEEEKQIIIEYLLSRK